MRGVFISHSARGDDLALRVLNEVRSGLAERGFEPHVDQDDLPPGAEWRPHVIDWLARCEAAVVLLNDKALDSTWVRREVNVLMWRRALGANLFVVPVLLGDLTTSAVKDAGLEELRPIQFARAAPGSAPDAGEIAAKVVAEFAQLPEPAGRDDPMSEWLRRLALYLAEARGTGLLLRAADALAVEREDHRAHVAAGHGGCEFLAHQFLVAAPDRMERALDEIAPSLRDDTLRRMIAALSSTWVDAEAARPLLPRREEPPRHTTVLLNSRARGTAEQYIRRATCAATRGYEVETVGGLPTGEDRAGERLRDWENAVWVQFFDAESERDRVLPADHTERTHYLVIDEACAPDADFAEAVRRLHDRFGWLIVVVTTGTEVPGGRVLAAFKDPILLEPPLTAQAEATARARNKRLKDLPGRLAGIY